MVRASYDQKPYRRIRGDAWRRGRREPVTDHELRRKVLGETLDSPGSLGIAISEAVEDAATRDDTKYSLGSVLNHVLLHQTVIGQEAIEQMGMAGESPDIIIGCTGGGSNFAGLTFPFLGRNFRDGATHRVIAVEPEAAPSLTRGVYAYDFGDTGKMTPLVKMHTLGSDFVPEPIHAGGPRHHGMAPLVSLLQGARLHRGAQRPPALQLRSRRHLRPSQRHPARARTESRHPVAIDEARAAKEAGEARVILFNLCGHGHFDLSAYVTRWHARGLRVPRREGRGGPGCATGRRLTEIDRRRASAARVP